MSTGGRWCAPAPSLWVCSVPFSLPLSLCHFACRVACEYGFISRFKGVFSAFWGADVCLYGFGSLRGLWGFCTRVELGGFGACGVFRLCFILFCPLSCPLFCPFALVFAFLFTSLLLLSLFVLLSSLSVGCCFFFPYGCMRKKKGRKVLSFASSLDVLFSRSNSCNVVKKLRCRCFGFFQFVRFILPANTTGVGGLARSYFYPLGHNINITNNCSSFLK